MGLGVSLGKYFGGENEQASPLKPDKTIEKLGKELRKKWEVRRTHSTPGEAVSDRILGLIWIGSYPCTQVLRLCITASPASARTAIINVDMST